MSDTIHSTQGNQIIGDEDRIRPVPRISIQAFCENPHTSKQLETIFQDRHLYRAHTTIHMGGLTAALEFYNGAPTPNLIIWECLAPSDELLTSLDRLADICDPGTRVMVIGASNDVLLYRELKRRGISEYFVSPLNQRLVVQEISEAFVEDNEESFGKLIAFIGAKGGVGSSTIAHNIAYDISTDFRQSVVLADLDLGYGTAGLNFNQDPIHGIAEAVFTAEKLDESMVDRLLCKCTDYLSLLAAPALLDREYDFDRNAFDSIISMVRKSVSYVVLDMPHVWTAWTKQILMDADDVVITATPDLACLRNVKNMLEMLKNVRQNDKMPYVILNQVGISKRPEISAADFERSLEIKLSAVVPFEPTLFGAAANNGQMLAEASSKAKATDLLRKLAHELSGKSISQKYEKTSALANLSKQLERLKRK